MRRYHELLQTYLEQLYHPVHDDLQKTLYMRGNEIYGEILYYSALKVIKQLKLTSHDHFLDIGSGIGKLVWYVYFNSPIGTLTGIEINPDRHNIAIMIQQQIKQKFPLLFQKQEPTLIAGDFLKESFDDVTVAYLCSTIFSFELLESVGKKLNDMPKLEKIASFRRIPHLSNFKMVKKSLIHCSWEQVSCYYYERVK